jgi:hypothetical protein
LSLRLPTPYIIEEPKHYVAQLNVLSFALAKPAQISPNDAGNI